MNADEADEFTAFVATRSAALLRTAYLLKGDDHAAEDLLQSALLATLRRWRRIRARDSLDAFARRVMVNERGLDLAQFVAGAPTMASPKRPEVFYGTHPEHFVGRRTGMAFMVMETIGMFGEPVLFKLSTHTSGLEPAQRDPDTSLTMLASGVLVSDNTPLRLAVMHQLQERPAAARVAPGPTRTNPGVQAPTPVRSLLRTESRT